MRHLAAWCICLVIACGAAPAAEPSFLIRVERRGAGDLAILRAAGLPVVQELDTCLLLEGNQESLAWLGKRGYEAGIIDLDPQRWDYLVAGLRPDSSFEALQEAGTVILAEGNWALLRIPPQSSIEALDRAQAFIARVPHEPVEPPRVQAPLFPLPARAADGEAPTFTGGDPGFTPGMAGLPLVQQIASSVSTAQINQFWTDLTTNPPTGTRYSSSQGCRDAATYCYNRYVSYGIPAQYQNWSTTRAPNVIGTLEGAVNPADVFIVIGHLDDLPSSGSAPGADDNASGSVNVLESARVLGCYAFRNTVKFINCTGEEQGLLGSSAYAADAANRGENILGVLNMDMIGWAGNGTPNPENLDLNYNDASQDLGLRFAQAAKTYNTGLVVDAFLCPSLTASDHAPFWQRGWKAVCGITDNEGYCSHAGNYPYYHRSTDTIANNGKANFFYSVVRTSVATLAELAQPFRIAFDRELYTCGGGAITVLLGDRDLNASPTAVEAASVDLSSLAEPTPETFLLTERSVNSMIFQGTIPTTSAPAVHGDGLLSVLPDDRLTVRYEDALDCTGAAGAVHTATAKQDCAAPAITGVQASADGNGATITWTTSEPATSVVRYGTAPGGGSATSDATLVTDHAVRLQGLAECATYYFRVESTDELGNEASSDNGGAWYPFTTGRRTSPTYAYTGPAAPIPDNDPKGASVSVEVPDPSPVVDVNLLVHLYHSFDQDLVLSLTGPDGTTVILSNRRGGSGRHFTDTVFDDQASLPIANGSAPFTGAFRPEQPLSAFNGRSASGTWTLKAVDNAGSDIGTIVEFELRLLYPPQVCSGLAIAMLSSEATDLCGGAGAGGGNGLVDPGETVRLVVKAHNAGSAPVTGIVASLSTTAPGVTVTNGSAVYGDLAPGTSAPGGPAPFAFFVDPSYPCGAAIPFEIRFTGNEGAWTDSFSFSTGTSAIVTPTFGAADLPKTIADQATTSSSLVVTEAGTVLDANVELTLAHTWDGDLSLALVAPEGARVPLASGYGSSGDNYTATTFDDEAGVAISTAAAPFSGAFRPDSPLSALDGTVVAGTWRLEVQDAGLGDSGTLQSWSLKLTASAVPACEACAPAQAGEVPGLAWSGPGTLAWGAAANATDYTVYRGSPATLPNLLGPADDSCRRLSTAGLATGPVLIEAPSPGSFLWYLVLARNSLGEGSAGEASAGPRILNAGAPCP